MLIPGWTGLTTAGRDATLAGMWSSALNYFFKRPREPSDQSPDLCASTVNDSTEPVAEGVPAIVHLNVGGQRFVTSRATLTNVSGGSAVLHDLKRSEPHLALHAAPAMLLGFVCTQPRGVAQTPAHAHVAEGDSHTTGWHRWHSRQLESLRMGCRSHSLE